MWPWFASLLFHSVLHSLHIQACWRADQTKTSAGVPSMSSGGSKAGSSPVTPCIQAIFAQEGQCVGWRGVLCWQMPVNQTRNGQARMPCKESTHNRPAGRGHTWRVNNNAWSAKNDTLARTPTTVGKPIVVTVSKTRTCNKTDGACEQSCPTVVGKPITVDQSKSQSCNTHASGTHTHTNDVSCASAG